MRKAVCWMLYCYSLYLLNCEVERLFKGRLKDGLSNESVAGCEVVQLLRQPRASFLSNTHN